MSAIRCSVQCVFATVTDVCVSNVSFQWEEFLKLGDDTDDKIVEDKITGQKPEDHCTLIYTVSVLIKNLSVGLLVLFTAIKFSFFIS